MDFEQKIKEQKYITQNKMIMYDREKYIQQK